MSVALRGLRARKGSALILVLLMTLAVAALAIAAIFMTSSAGLLSRFYDKERLYRLGAEAALERTRSRLLTDLALAIPDTGMLQVLSGWTPSTAGGTPVSGVAVNVYAAATGDTSGLQLPFVTLVAAAYDAAGTRHVRRMDLRRESFSRYQYFVDSFPAGLTHGPGVVAGRVHSNHNWVNAGSSERFLDTVTVVGSISGSATYEVPAVTGVVRVPFPKDSTFMRLDTLAANAGLRFGSLSGRQLRVEFVAIDANNDGTVGSTEGFFKVFELAAGRDSTYLVMSPPRSTWYISPPVTWVSYHLWDDPRIQNQCGAFYIRAGRWHFFPISTHRRTWARSVIQATGSGNYPAVSNGTMNGFDNYDYDAARDILAQPTARCFPAGSPYLMPSERMTNTSGAVTGTVADSVPFGVVTPAGGWPGGVIYGGNDTTFTVRSRTCFFITSPAGGNCDPGTLGDLGSWRTGTNPTGISASVRQALEVPYLWAYGVGSSYNTASRGVLSVTTSPVYVSGVVAGRVTLRASGRVGILDGLDYATDPNAPEAEACAHDLGILAVGDVLVVETALTRVRRIGRFNGFFSAITHFSEHLGSGKRVQLVGSLMSLTGTVGVENPGVTMGASTSQPVCPEDAATSTRSNGGCWALTGGAIMRRYTSLYGGTDQGMRYRGRPERCQSSTRRPPFFPLTNRYTKIRTLEIEPSTANSPTKIRNLLLRLKGKTL